ncbi:formyl-CoA transferase [Pigmentiphaga soli]|uniref:Formyl-CoA transferase n=1 Tax=Pigmentiphaga soli TaxID=1007095 RepID=A0ABP8HNL1_9BURK
MNQSTGAEGQGKALSGIKVVDFTQFESGTSCTQSLAWLGADVVKIEEPRRGESGRYASTEQVGIDSYFFILMNANKRSLACDIKSEAGRRMVRELIAQADVFIENMSPGTIERLGFGYDEVRRINPRIIYAQIKGFAPDGPYANYLSFDYIAQSVGVSVSLTGVEGGPPLKPGPNVGDTGAGLHCTIGILSALLQRQITGQGQRIEVSMQDAVINFNRINFAAQLMRGRPPERKGNQGVLGTSAPCELYPCRPFGQNDYVFIYTSRGGNKQWHALLKVIEREDLMDDPRFCSPEARIAHVRDVDALLAQWCSHRTKIEAMEMLQRGGVPAGAVLDTQELMEDEHLRRRGTFAAVRHPVRGEVVMPGWPVKMSASHVEVTSAPLLGAHTEEVLQQWLGWDERQIEAYVERLR